MNHQHSANCSGCPMCNAEMRAVLSMSPDQYSRWLTESRLHTAVGKRDLSAYVPPDPYAAGIAARRAAQGIVATTVSDDELADHIVEMEMFRRAFFDMAATSHLATLAPATSDVHRSPPDGYALALQKRREQSGGAR